MKSYERSQNRIKDIYILLKKSKEPVPSKDIAEAFHCSMKTVQRDLRLLEYNHLVKSVGRGKWKAS